MSRKIEPDVMRILVDEGATDIKVDRGRHLKFRFTYNGRRLLVTASSTSGDVRTIKNTRADIRRAIRNASK